ncbi:MAG TPA: ABC transporter ATP-binding protein [Candidatus Bathyarchaeia archaeon]|nr:ABC transporter ATP-binding protein [Candidatus Bathyarchaeia archaeon]
MESLVSTVRLLKRYGDRTVVKGIDLQINRGEVLAIIGPNGAGKSTTLEMVIGVRKPDEGTVRYWCQEPNKHIGVQLQTTPFFPELNTQENLRLFAAFYGVNITDQQLNDTLARCGLEGARKTDASKLSGGQQKRLAIAMTLVHNPELIFLDEPTAALDPRARHEIRELISKLSATGTSIVFTSHDMEEVEKLATRVIMIADGQVRASGTIEQLKQQHRVQNLEQLYLTLTE